MTADRIVLVEGISDRIVVCAVADRLGRDLDRNGVLVVALNGAGNFRPAIHLFGLSGFGIRLLGLVDRNEQSITAEALVGVAVADLIKHDAFICHADLEEECATSLGVPDTIELLVRSGLFKEVGILSSVGATSVAAVSATDLAGFLRKNKLEVAAAIAEGLDAA